MASSERRSVAACHDHGARIARADQRLERAAAGAASRPSAQPVAVVGRREPLLVESRGRLAEDEPDRAGRAGCRGSARPRQLRARASRRRGSPDDGRGDPFHEAAEVVPKRASRGPSAPPSSRWMKPGPSRKPSSNASHGFRSRHGSGRGDRILPPAIRTPGRGPVRAPSRLAGRTACRNASLRAASTGRRAEVALDPVEDGRQPDQLAVVWRSRSLVGEVLVAPSGAGKRSR